MIPSQKKSELLYLSTLVKNPYSYHRAQFQIILLRIKFLFFSKNFPLIETDETGTLGNRVSTTNKTLSETTAPHFPPVDPPARRGTSPRDRVII